MYGCSFTRICSAHPPVQLYCVISSTFQRLALYGLVVANMLDVVHYAKKVLLVWYPKLACCVSPKSSTMKR